MGEARIAAKTHAQLDRLNFTAYGVPVWQREGKYEVLKHEVVMAMLKPT